MIKKTLDFIIYSNVWISLGALVLSIQTKGLLLKCFNVELLDWFIACATFTLYAGHRLIGIHKTRYSNLPTRFSYLYQFTKLFTIVIIVAGATGILLFSYLPKSIQWGMLFPILIGIGYALPILPHHRRLRDIGTLKAFLVAFSWSWVTVILPALSKELLFPAIWMMFFARFFFILAIALAFDLRDAPMDSQQSVNTIPVMVGEQYTKIISLFCLSIMLFFIIWNYQIGSFTIQNVIAFVLSAFLTGITIWKAKAHYSDYYFSGLLDGMILLQSIMIWLIR